MPRAHTEDERRTIHERLLRAGRTLFVRVGLQRVTIAELARAAGIGKGSFYGFFESKEALFVAVQQREEAAFKGALLAEAETADSAEQALRALLTAAATRLEQHPFLQLLLDPETLRALTLRVAPELLEAHRREDEAFFARLVERWGDRVAPEGEVDRGAVGEIVFEYPDELAWLESVLHPLVGERVVGWRRGLSQDVEVAVVEVPLLFEGSMAEMFDATIAISAGDGERRRRADARGTGALEARSGRQLSQEEKSALATHAITNDGTVEELQAELTALYPILREAGR